MAGDPLSNILDVLGARMGRQTRMEAAGRWALEFPAVERLKFVAMLRGSQWLLLPGGVAHQLNEGDVCLIGRTAYRTASAPDVEPVDGQPFFEHGDVARIGGADIVAIGGTVTVAPGLADFLLDVLPDFMMVPKEAAGSSSVATILALLGAEIERDEVGGEVVSARLADVLLVEAIRACAARRDGTGIGWLGALSDDRLGRALRAIHADVARPWTVATLAGVAGMSRAAFAAAFARRVGYTPLAYVRTWRLTVARAAMLRGGRNIGAVASDAGYGSQSAFGQAFKRAFGVSPGAVVLT
ncbi:AraC family transcriptional regulator [Sphingomonas prati]|uniref:AraC-like DNA-binding protein n=1 Tax=Sphingomonas prati TaxID=1843237 RepID=A0A7W9BVG4_9SPHN|nr:AraC family transcriptional regulator [Sphingomonas prati]MBB5730781.1 AraC-like DNA-binding protein [Sphingomonas prati]GGE96723.1 AraC family transcriptional regulator [Sphingomonas prati]